MKKAFTLIEILMAITIFSFIVLALYKVTNIAKLDIESITSLLEDKTKKNYQKSILIEDFLESQEINIDTKEHNSVVQLKSNNTYHNPLYTQILYLVHNNTLYRIESLEKLSKENIHSIDPNNIFIDILYKNIKSFIVEKGKNNSYMIYIKNKTDNKEEIITVIGG